jgi:hypothetical protein
MALTTALPADFSKMNFTHFLWIFLWVTWLYSQIQKGICSILKMICILLVNRRIPRQFITTPLHNQAQYFRSIYTPIVRIMSSYLLLRNNRQSGPLTKEELLQLGIKPYDLVWVEGKSAAWRYPGELPELKEFAPMVEEQPYDRFFKKKTEEQKVLVLETVTQVGETVPVKTGSVSVILPKQAVPVKKAEPVYAFIPEPAPHLAEKPVEVETKYSLPLDEIKERYVKQLQERKHKTAQKKWVVQALKKAAIFIAIIGAGVLIGFAIKPKNSGKNSIVNQPVENVSPGTSNTPEKKEIMPADSNQTNTIKTNGVNEQADNNNNGITNEKSSILEKKKVNEQKDELLSGPVEKPGVINPSNGERNKISRNNSDENGSGEKSGGTEVDLSTFVSVKANNYKLRDFGGFRNLELTVTNNSKISLDNVLVELQYLKINDEPAKIEHIPFRSISPGGSLTIRVPDNNRGAKLTYKIIKIDPKDSNTKTAGL